MALPNFTPEEQFLRSYYLTVDGSWRQWTREIPYLLPSVVVAGIGLWKSEPGAFWIAFLYLLGCYIWRIAGGKWSLISRSLIEKYEARIAELEARETL
jgi:hypothetical protein